MESDNYTIFIKFQKIIGKRFELVSATISTKIKQSGDKKNYVPFFGKKSYDTISIFF